MDTRELIKKVRKIEIKTKGLTNHIFSGEYHSAFKGRGMSFSEVRNYQYGDDVRNIDWNVTARTGDPYIKIFEEERELTVMLLIDVSKSAFFGTHSQFKNELITEISAVLAFSAINNNDKVGCILFSDHPEMYISPQKGRKHTLRIIRELINYKPKQPGTDIGKALQYLNNVVKKKCICFVLSDFQDKDYFSALRIVSKHHDTIAVHVFDPKEEELPDMGLLQVIDAETGEPGILDTTSKSVRDSYTKWYSENIGFLQKSVVRCGADLISIKTDEPYIKALMTFFKKRAKYMR